MPDSDPRSHSSEGNSSANRIFRRAKSLLRGLLALVCLGVGAIGILITLLTVLGGSPYWTLGIGLGSAGALYLGWSLLPSWGSDSSEQPETQDQNATADQGNERKRETGQSDLARGAKTTRSWVEAGFMMWFFLLPMLLMGIAFVGIGASSLIEAVRTDTVQDGVFGSMFALMGIGFLYGAGHMIHMIWTSDEKQTGDEREPVSAGQEGTFQASERNRPGSYGGTASTLPPGQSFRRSGVRQVGRRLVGTVSAIGCGWFFLIPFLTILIYGEVLAVNGYLAGRTGLLPTLGVSALLLISLGVIGSVLVKTWQDQGESAEEETKELGNYRSAWSTRRIPASRYPKSVPSPTGTILFGLVLATGLGVGIYYGIRQDLWTEDIGATIAIGVIVGLPLIGLALYLLRAGYNAVRHRRRYNRGVFEMDEFPAVLGGTLRGTVETGMSLEDRPSKGFHVKVTCGRVVGGETSSFRRLWSTEQQVEGEPRAGRNGIAVPVDIDLPEDQPASKLDDSSPPIHWRLTIRADGVDPPYGQLFKIPVLSPDHRLAR